MKKNIFLNLMASAIIALASFTTASAQSEIYPQHFDLEDVTLLDGPFLKAMNTNITMLLRYDTDRLLTPFVRQAGLSDKQGSEYYGWVSKHPSFPNWGQSDWSLEGHAGGHYMTGLALAYAACHDETKRATIKKRIDYIVKVMKDCQTEYDTNTQGMKGFIGGQPINPMWMEMYTGKTDLFARYGGWVPFYCQHKVLAGLRDIYLYTDGETAETAKELFKNLCDWSIKVVSKYDTNTMQYILGWEHGGMNETLIDAYKIFGETKYLSAAKKYSHQYMIDGMQTLNTTFLNGKHANTQVPKYIGFERIYEESKSLTAFRKAAENFWDDVAQNRTVSIGGNSVNEHFLGQDGNAYINEPDGPESCNTNNMLKLSENLFDRTHNAKYADFYEAAMWNHILSTQDPKTGGYVYFTPLRPQSYRIYSQVNKGMWCCVGTGMENHSKYGHFIYTHSVSKDENAKDTLFVNLFTASELNSEKFGVRQETSFPYEQKTRITVTKPGTFVLAVRKPKWVDGKAASYTFYDKTWAEGETVEVDLPMQLSYEQCPNMPDYIAFKYGPILLAARTTKMKSNDPGDLEYESLVNEYGNEGRMDHSEKSCAKNLPLSTAPMLIGERSKVLERITKNEDSESTLHFSIDVTLPFSASYKWTTLELEPFFSLHHSRYMNYWYQQTEEGFANSDWAKEEAKKQLLEERTIDFVATGEQQSEAGHNYDYSTNSSSGMYNGEYYRDAQNGGHIQYTLYNPEGYDDYLAVICRFTTADKGRKGTLKVDGTAIADIEITTAVKADDKGFYNYEVPIPESLIFDAEGNVKKEFKVRLEANKGTICPGLYYMRLTHGNNAHTYVFHASDWVTGDAGRIAQSNIKYDEEANTITMKAGTGQNNVCLGFDHQKHQDYTIGIRNKYLVVRGTNLSTTSGKSFLWWLNGKNKGSSIAPTTVKKVGSDYIIAWDITKTDGLDANCMEDGWNLKEGATIFGLTSTSGTSVISDINFVTDINEYVKQATSISSTALSQKKGSTEFYSLSGARNSSPRSGINIVRTSDGEVKKVFVK